MTVQDQDTITKEESVLEDTKGGVCTPSATCLIHVGKVESEDAFQVVNPPVYRASTVIHKDLKTLQTGVTVGNHWTDYGRTGTPTRFALEDALCTVQEGAGAALVTPSGLSACTLPMLALLSPGDHILVSDGIYGKTRYFCEEMLATKGIHVSYYAPSIDARGLEAQVRPQTKMIYMEQPSSWTLEVQDVPGIVAVAKKYNILTALDNTWSGGLFFPAFSYGVDVVMHSLTKFCAGHSDLILGGVMMNKNLQKEHAQKIINAHGALGLSVSADDAYTALRGIRTLPLRLAHLQRSGIAFATWLAEQKGVLKVFYPPLPSHPMHACWKRDFTGATSLMSAVLDVEQQDALAPMVDHMQLFYMGQSWGGYESLLLPVDVAKTPRGKNWKEKGQLLRIYIGLEDIEDLKADFAAGLARLFG